MSAHTPGPWAWRDRYDFREHLAHQAQGLDADCENIREGRITLIGADETTVLGEWADYAGDSGLGITEADARLIAAAPELLEACEVMLDDWELWAADKQWPEILDG